MHSPPPPHINEAEVVRAIDLRKDVDGFHPVNVDINRVDDPASPKGDRLVGDVDYEAIA